MRPAEPACWSWPVTDAHRAQAAQGFESDVWIRLGAEFICEWQQDRCAICAASSPRLELDHDHGTGLIRGWLCRSCNQAEGRRSDAVFVMYRERPPAVMLGVREVYTSIWGPSQPAGPAVAMPLVDQVSGETVGDAIARYLLSGG
jgi:hypothetical protein